MTEEFENDDEGVFADRSYRVGYAKPPKEHQFKAGNKAAAGRRKKRNELVGEVITRNLNQKITVTVNGKRRRITKLDAIVQMMMQAAGKSPRDALRLLSWVSGNEPEPVPEWVDSRIKLEFVHRDWSDNPFPGADSLQKPGKKGGQT
jgi:hypothetical protein